MRKRFLIYLIICFFFSIIFLLNTISASPPPSNTLPYVFNTITPRAGNLQITDFAGVNLYSGTMVYAYPLQIPPGTNNLQPEEGKGRSPSQDDFADNREVPSTGGVDQKKASELRPKTTKKEEPSLWDKIKNWGDKR